MTTLIVTIVEGAEGRVDVSVKTRTGPCTALEKESLEFLIEAIKQASIRRMQTLAGGHLVERPIKP